MSGVNKVILVGNLGADPEMRSMPSGKAVANLSLATSESWKDKDSGKTIERTEWHKVIFFGKQAEVLNQYCSKGSMLYVEGKLQTRKWQAKDGSDRYTTEINGNVMQMLGGGKDKPARGKEKPEPPPEPPMDFDDDILF